MKDKLGQEPAFPIKETKYTESIELGISKRLYIATMAMQGILAGIHTSEDAYNSYGFTARDKKNSIGELIAIQSFLYANELLKQASNEETN